MRRPSRRILPTVIGVSVVTTLAANGAVLIARGQAPAKAAPQTRQESYVAASGSNSLVSLSSIAPLRKRLTPHLLVAAPSSLPPDVADKVRRVKGIRGVEVLDAAQAMVGGKRVGLLGVDPSTFRNYTPKPTAESDALWRNIASGDVAISFSMGNDGAVQLGSQIPVGGRQRSSTLRVGAYATMGIGDVDAVISHGAAQKLGMPGGNALLVSSPKTDLKKLAKQLRKVLPKQARTLEITPKIDYPSPGGLPSARGQVLTATQVNTAIQAARSRIGFPYVWGGESEAEGGYDCSGLLQYAFARAGVKLPRVAADQARSGWVIPFNKAQPGDLLIWANDPTNPGYISHISLYIGNGKMVVARQTGTLIQIQDVFFRNFKGAVRVNPQQGAKLKDSGL